MINNFKKGLFLLNKQKGFSLVELLVAIVIIGFLVIVLSRSLISTLRSNMKAEVVKEVKENGDYVMEYIGRIIRNAKSVTIDGNVCRSGVNFGGFNTILATDLDDNPTTISCSAGQITVRSNVIISDSTLTSETVTANNCAFSCTTNAGSPTVVEVSLNLRQRNAGDQFEEAQQDFSSTFVLRNRE